MDKRRELSKKTFLWPCPEETEPIWESIYVFRKGQVRVRGQEAAHSSESTVSTENLQVFLDEVPILPPQAVLNDDGEQSTQGPLAGCSFPQWNDTKAELLPSNVLSSAPTCFYHSLGPWIKSDFLCLFPCQVYKLLESRNNALPCLYLPLPREGMPCVHG